jgi:hypothetical protein
MKSRRLKTAPSLDKASYRSSLARWMRAGCGSFGEGRCPHWVKADLAALKSDFRYTPDTGHCLTKRPCPKSANFGSREPYSIASSAKLTVTEEW